MRLILASTSRYRRALLERLGIAFEAVAPDVDETPRSDELPHERATRLAKAKALAVAKHASDAWVIGSDQVAALGSSILRKPITRERAVAQLAQSSGQTVDFFTALSLARGQHMVSALDHTRVQFRVLDRSSIERYIEREQPLDCAGAFKCEALGITLFERIDASDPTALIGLPLIALSRMLREAGWQVP
jgi:septum formation protein